MLGMFVASFCLGWGFLAVKPPVMKLVSSCCVIAYSYICVFITVSVKTSENHRAPTYTKVVNQGIYEAQTVVVIHGVHITESVKQEKASSIHAVAVNTTLWNTAPLLIFFIKRGS